MIHTYFHLPSNRGSLECRALELTSLENSEVSRTPFFLGNDASSLCKSFPTSRRNVSPSSRVRDR